jgi:hypothetical protein
LILEFFYYCFHDLISEGEIFNHYPRNRHHHDLVFFFFSLAQGNKIEAAGSIMVEVGIEDIEGIDMGTSAAACSMEAAEGPQYY